MNAVGRGGTPLIAAAGRWPNEVKELLDAKADPNVADSSGSTPLLAAVCQRQLESAKLLLAAGANPNATSPAMESPLGVAVRTANLDMVTLLLHPPIDVNAENARGQTPLHILAWWCNPGDAQACTAIAQMLINFGAKRNALDQQGQTAADIALNKGMTDLASVIAGRKLTATRRAGPQIPVQVGPRPWPIPSAPPPMSTTTSGSYR